ncbi:hypothetical protein KKB44_06410 [Candidatus Micrarchaeota archaeon]|nr:hypothetical protein [Candidatus Micrarchaeota archaeon]
MKGQSSLELLITVGIVIAFTIPVLFLLLSVTSIGYEDTAKAQAEASTRTLSDTINLVYAQGDGAKRLILLNTPPSTKEVSVEDGEVIVTILTSGGEFEAVHPTIAVVKTVSLGGRTGLFLISVENVDGEVELH